MVDQCRSAVQVVFEERAVQQVSKAIDKDLTREMLISFFDIHINMVNLLVFKLVVCGAIVGRVLDLKSARN